jgi:hypothetical protein
LTVSVVHGHPPPGRPTAHTQHNQYLHFTANLAWATITRTTERAPNGPQAIRQTPGFGQPNGAGECQTSTGTTEQSDSHKNPDFPAARRPRQRTDNPRPKGKTKPTT